MKLTVEIFIRIIIAVLLVFSAIHFMTPMLSAIVNIGNITGVAVSVILFFMVVFRGTFAQIFSRMLTHKGGRIFLFTAARATPQETMEQWLNSPQHRATILNPNLTHMGIGAAYEQNSEYEYYWTQLFVISDAHFQNEYIPRRHNIIPQCEGDITGDAAVDTFDYISLADYIYKRSQNIPVYFNPEQLQTADCFRDGLITESDAKVLVRYILGEYDTLPYVF